MKRKKSRSAARKRRHTRVRMKVIGTSERPRLNVFRSLTGIYAQLIDDENGHTLASASNIHHELRSSLQNLEKTEQAKKVGVALAERAKEQGIENVVFDRGGYKYMGRVKALADAARENGLKF